MRGGIDTSGGWGGTSKLPGKTQKANKTDKECVCLYAHMWQQGRESETKKMGQVGRRCPPGVYGGDRNAVSVFVVNTLPSDHFPWSWESYRSTKSLILEDAVV